MTKQVSTNARQQISSPLGGRGPANSGNLDNAIEAEDLTKYYGEVLAVDHPGLNLAPLLRSGLLFLWISERMHERSRRLGY